MSVLALTSTSGSPGVTTTALGLAMLWPRQVLLVEADPATASPVLAGYLRSTIPMPPEGGLQGLAQAVFRHDHLDKAWLNRCSLPMPAEHARLLPGWARSDPGEGLGRLWAPLAEALATMADAGVDVIIDAGRLGHRYEPRPLLMAADQVLLMTHSDLPGIAAAQPRFRALTDQFDRAGAGEDVVKALLVDSGEYGVRDASAVFGTNVAGTVAWDPPAARVYSHGAPPPRRFERSPWVRSLHALQSSVTTSMQARQRRLDTTLGGAHV